MCSACEVTETGLCTCGTSLDPEARTDTCGAKTAQAYCSVCNHAAGATPADTNSHGSDYQEY
jgi:hypothetical protein